MKVKLKTDREGGDFMKGWACPRCGKIHGPFVRECDCPPKTEGASTLLSTSLFADYTNDTVWDNIL